MAGRWAGEDGAVLANDPNDLLPQLMDELSFFQEAPAGLSAARQSRAAPPAAAEPQRAPPSAAPVPQRTPHAQPVRAAVADVDALLATSRDGRALLRELNELLLVRAIACACIRRAALTPVTQRRARAARRLRRCACC